MPSSRNTIRVYALANMLLGGLITAATLDMALAVGANQTAFNSAMDHARLGPKIMSSDTAMNIVGASQNAMSLITAVAARVDALTANAVGISAIANQDVGTAAMAADSYAALKLVTTATALDAYMADGAKYDRLKAQVNAVGSKIKRQVFTASGTWTYPAAGIRAISTTVVGAGGRGANVGGGGGYNRGGGGGGGEVSLDSRTASLPAADVTVTVGSTAASSSFGALNTAAGGTSGTDRIVSAGGTYGTAGGNGGGSGDTGGGKDSVTDLDFPNAAWQANTCRVKGGDGGDALSGDVVQTSVGNGGDGCGTGGTFGAGNNAGTGYGAGAGCGDWRVLTDPQTVNGEDAAANSGCGGGGGSERDNGGGQGLGGAAGTGLVVVHWIEM